MHTPAHANAHRRTGGAPGGSRERFAAVVSSEPNVCATPTASTPRARSAASASSFATPMSFVTCTDSRNTELQKYCELLNYRFILSEGHRASHETVREHETLQSGSAAINTPHTKRYWAAAQRETPHNIGPQTCTYTYTHTELQNYRYKSTKKLQNAFGDTT